MKLGEKAELFIKSEYGYGDQGSPPKIPGGATLIFKVELVQIGDREAGQKSDEELLKFALGYKDEGNGLFKAGSNQTAVQVYLNGVEHVEKIREPTEESKKLAVVLYQNLSLAGNKLGKYQQALEMCSRALAVDEKATKALYIRSQAQMGLKETQAAMDDIKAAIKLAPNDKNFRAQFEKIKKQKQDEAKATAGQMQALFSQGLYNEKEVEITK